MLDTRIVDEIILRALKEDMPMGDITTDSTISEDSVSKARLIAKENGVLSGITVAIRVFKLMDSNIVYNTTFKDGDKIKKGDILLELEGNTRALLKAERTALNLLQRMSGIATRTNGMFELIKDYPAKIVDTRKTAPGLRYLDKYAVRSGGGQNHRYCLSDGVLIKDNHIKAAGSITNAIRMCRAQIPHTVKIEVETENMDMVKEALEAGADIIMLDNMSCDEMKKAVDYVAGRALIEASGDISENSVTEVAKTGVDLISAGNLTHSVKALDISMKFL